MAVGKYLPEANPGPAETVGATIKTAYEGEANTNAFTDAEKTKLGTVDTNADVTGDNAPKSHTIASHDTDTTGAELTSLGDNSIADTLHRHSELSASDGTPDAVVSVDSDGILYADAAPVGIDILYSGVIGAHLTVGNDIIVGGTVDGVDIAARDHAESHSVASHNDTTATGANLNTLVGGGETDLHSHAAAVLVLIWEFHAVNATLADFQANAATGNMAAPEGINDNNLINSAYWGNPGNYARVDFGKVVKIDQWRFYGSSQQNNDGEVKLQYRSSDGNWYNWVTGISTRGETWTIMSSETEVMADAIQVVVVTADSGVNRTKVGELEVYHTG